MPKKPARTRRRYGTVKRNEMHDAAGGVLLAGNATLAAAAVDIEMRDSSEGHPLDGRYTRVRAELMKQYGCSKAVAERAIAEGKVLFIEQWKADLPERRERLSVQLQAIADAHQHTRPSAAIRALREIGLLNGCYAPTKVEVEHSAEMTLQLDAILEVLDDAGHAALEVLQQQIERAKSEGRLALPEPQAKPVIDIEDAEIVEPEPGSN